MWSLLVFPGALYRRMAWSTPPILDDEGRLWLGFVKPIRSSYLQSIITACSVMRFSSKL